MLKYFLLILFNEIIKFFIFFFKQPTISNLEHPETQRQLKKEKTDRLHKKNKKGNWNK